MPPPRPRNPAAAASGPPLADQCPAAAGDRPPGREPRVQQAQIEDWLAGEIAAGQPSCPATGLPTEARPGGVVRRQPDDPAALRSPRADPARPGPPGTVGAGMAAPSWPAPKARAGPHHPPWPGFLRAKLRARHGNGGPGRPRAPPPAQPRGPARPGRGEPALQIGEGGEPGVRMVPARTPRPPDAGTIRPWNAPWFPRRPPFSPGQCWSAGWDGSLYELARGQGTGCGRHRARESLEAGDRRGTRGPKALDVAEGASPECWSERHRLTPVPGQPVEFGP